MHFAHFGGRLYFISNTTMNHSNFKPLLASRCDLLSLKYPLAVTPKLDGVRAIIRDGTALSRSLKPIRSKVVQSILGGLPSGCDGEIVCNNGSFQGTVSSVMSEDGQLNWTYHIFDFLDFSTPEIAPYTDRMHQLQEHLEQGRLNENCKVIYPEFVYDKEALMQFVQEHLDDGYEGTMVRDPSGTYKFGRSTVNQGILLKIKAFEDAEARIIGVEEQMHNDNVAELDELGYTKRSTSKENLVPASTLGSLLVQSLEDERITFKIGTGFDAQQRQELWNRRDELIGQYAKYKFFNQGIVLRPRHPVFIGLRPVDDM